MKDHAANITIHQKIWQQVEEKCFFMKLTTFFISKTKQIYQKTLTVSESALE